MADSFRAPAAKALLDAFKRMNAVAVDPAGYVGRVEDNLLAGITREMFEADFSGAGGSELLPRDDGKPPKFCAVHSSAALAVNSFARWKQHAGELSLFGIAGFEWLRFEGPCPSGFAGTPPTLDLLARDAKHVVGVESKCLEYFDGHKAEFSPSYDAVDNPSSNDARRDSPWFRELQALRKDSKKYARLDAAQLIKHYLGLAHTYPATGQPLDVTLGYVFWEPENWREVEPCRQHREETARFSAAVGGDRVGFQWMTYQDLWNRWDRLDTPAWLRAHVAALRKRYAVRLPV
jgi:hypothetical protein